MIVTRLAYLLIGAVIAVMAVAIYIVLNPDEAGNDPHIELDDVIAYSRLGAVERIEVRERTLIVRFKEGFPTQETLGSDSRTFEAALPPGASITTMLESAGVTVGDDGVRVETR